MKEFSQKAVLTEGSVEKTLFNLTMPMILGLLSIFSFNLADTWFVSKLGTEPLAAIGFTFPVAFFFNSVATGLGVGVVSVISQAIGRGDTSSIKRLTFDSLLLGLAVVFVLASVGVLTIDSFFRMLGANEDLMPMIKDYMFYWYLGSIFLIVPMVGNNAIRATGDAKTPCLIMTSAAVVNIILDPIMIFGLGKIPAMGIKGAAIATVIGQAIMLFASVYVLARKKKMLTFEMPKLKEVINSWQKILYIGLPATTTQLMSPICNAIYTRMIATFGVAAVAAYGASFRIEAFAILPIISLGTSVSPFVGQNFGAGNIERTNTGIKRSCQFSMLWGLFCYIFFIVFGSVLANSFAEDYEVQQKIMTFFKIMPICYGFFGVFMVITMAFNAIGYPKRSTVLNFVRLFCFSLPFAFIGGQISGYSGLFIGAISANILAGFMSWWSLKRCNATVIC